MLSIVGIHVNLENNIKENNIKVVSVKRCQIKGKITKHVAFNAKYPI